MTLLEAVIAFVILSVAGVVCLDQARGAARLQASSAEWTAAVLRGESAMVEAAGQAPPDAALVPATFSAIQVSRRAWKVGVDEITVMVPMSGGAMYRTSRLVPRATASGQ